MSPPGLRIEMSPGGRAVDEDPRGPGKSRGHRTVPGRQHLVVEMRAGPPLELGEQGVANLRQCRHNVLDRTTGVHGHLLDGLRGIQKGLPVKSPAGRSGRCRPARCRTAGTRTRPPARGAFPLPRLTRCRTPLRTCAPRRRPPDLAEGCPIFGGIDQRSGPSVAPDVVERSSRPPVEGVSSRLCGLEVCNRQLRLVGTTSSRNAGRASRHRPNTGETRRQCGRACRRAPRRGAPLGQPQGRSGIDAGAPARRACSRSRRPGSFGGRPGRRGVHRMRRETARRPYPAQRPAQAAIPHSSCVRAGHAAKSLQESAAAPSTR